MNVQEISQRIVELKLQMLERRDLLEKAKAEKKSLENDIEAIYGALQDSQYWLNTFNESKKGGVINPDNPVNI